MTSRYSSFEVEVPQQKTGSKLGNFYKVSSLTASCLMCLFAVLNIILLLIVLTSQSFTIESGFTKLLPIVDFIADNLNAPPIMNIALSRSLQCSGNYVLETLTTWPGTIEGCYCPQRNSVYPGKCGTTDQGSCQTVNPTNARDLFIWKNEGYCVQRAKDYFYRPFEQECLEGYTNCGQFCIKQGEGCPITSMSIVTKDQNTGNEVESVELTQDRILLITRDLSQTSLYELNVSLYDKPCLQPGYVPSKEGLVYPLIDVPGYGCGEFEIDDSAGVMESLNSTTFFSQNKMTDATALPLYLESEYDGPAYLVYRPRIAMKVSRECQAIDTKKLGQLKENIGSFKRWVVGGTLFPIIVIFIYLIYLIYLFFDEGLNKFTKKATRRIVSWILMTGCLAIIIWYKTSFAAKNQEILDQQVFYSTVGTSDCFENNKISLALETFSYYIPSGTASIMSYVNLIYWASIALYVLTIAIIVFEIVYGCCFKD